MSQRSISVPGWAMHQSFHQLSQDGPTRGAISRASTIQTIAPLSGRYHQPVAFGIMAKFRQDASPLTCQAEYAARAIMGLQ